MSKVEKVDLTLLKDLVSKLEEHINNAESLEGSKEANNSAIIEMSRAYGIVASVAQEATFLAGDIRKQVRIKSAGAVAAATAGGKDLSSLSDEELMTAIFGPAKGSDDTKN